MEASYFQTSNYNNLFTWFLNAVKSECMFVLALTSESFVPPNVYSYDNVLKYVTSFKYLGHIITPTQSDEHNMLREGGSLYYRGNMLIRTLPVCTDEVKCGLLGTFCYSMHGSFL